MFEAFEGFITVSVPIAVGYLVARSGLLTARTGVELNRLAVTVLMPVLLFTILSEAEPSTLFSHLALVSLLAAVAMFALYVLLAGLFWRRGAGELAVGAMAAGYTNANNIGLPIALHMLGDPTLVAPIVLFQTGVFAPVGLTILAVGARRRGGGGRGGYAGSGDCRRTVAWKAL
ncbi:MAG: AEC family transporter [Bifidobacteriaceae bacterium]|nr:AEC family transporter [Bifidobacteriaceae bacterium]